MYHLCAAQSFLVMMFSLVCFVVCSGAVAAPDIEDAHVANKTALLQPRVSSAFTDVLAPAPIVASASTSASVAAVSHRIPATRTLHSELGAHHGLAAFISPPDGSAEEPFIDSKPAASSVADMLKPLTPAGQPQSIVLFRSHLADVLLSVVALQRASSQQLSVHMQRVAHEQSRESSSQQASPDSVTVTVAVERAVLEVCFGLWQKHARESEPFVASTLSHSCGLDFFAYDLNFGREDVFSDRIEQVCLKAVKEEEASAEERRLEVVRILAAASAKPDENHLSSHPPVVVPARPANDISLDIYLNALELFEIRRALLHSAYETDILTELYARQGRSIELPHEETLLDADDGSGRGKPIESGSFGSSSSTKRSHGAFSRSIFAVYEVSQLELPLCRSLGDLMDLLAGKRNMLSALRTVWQLQVAHLHALDVIVQHHAHLQSVQNPARRAPYRQVGLLHSASFLRLPRIKAPLLHHLVAQAVALREAISREPASTPLAARLQTQKIHDGWVLAMHTFSVELCRAVTFPACVNYFVDMQTFFRHAHTRLPPNKSPFTVLTAEQSQTLPDYLMEPFDDDEIRALHRIKTTIDRARDPRCDSVFVWFFRWLQTWVSLD
jgi:hypothetical protein